MNLANEQESIARREREFGGGTGRAENGGRGDAGGGGGGGRGAGRAGAGGGRDRGGQNARVERLEQRALRHRLHLLLELVAFAFQRVDLRLI